MPLTSAVVMVVSLRSARSMVRVLLRKNRKSISSIMRIRAHDSSFSNSRRMHSRRVLPFVASVSVKTLSPI
ncbi:hypothetical protein OJJOAM_001500 [Cupriavidus sp. H18C1]|uniref:hypothetical protein n=1 Tax=Cupriavidus sp. H18C1 TaxID=3241601 RepID=UPI003BB98400